MIRRVAGLMLKVWCSFFDIQDEVVRKAVCKILKNKGLDVIEFKQEFSAVSGIIFFKKNTQPLCDYLLGVTKRGLNHIVAISLGDCALSPEAVWQVLNTGVCDVIDWNESDESVQAIISRLNRIHKIEELLKSTAVENNFIGKGSAWLKTLRQVVEMANFTSSSALIMGETGTGKEMVARLFHTMDSRPSKGSLVLVDCTTIVPELSGSEFFGHERGAFTGAVVSREGAFALANRGTLFLDEVGELPLGLQAQLLRVIQVGTYKRVGGNTWHETNFRLVCATNRDLYQEVARGNFRSDLYYRLSEWTCTLPPLRERPEDILPLVYHFMAKANPGGKKPELTHPVEEFFLRRAYSGNVRELKQVVARILHRYPGEGPLTVGMIPEGERLEKPEMVQEWCEKELEHSVRRALSSGVGLKEIGRKVENLAVQMAVEQEDGNLQKAARRLGVTDRALQLRRATELKSLPFPQRKVDA